MLENAHITIRTGRPEPEKVSELDQQINEFRLRNSVLLEKEDTSVSYATIIEVHHPEYLDLDDLRRLYPVSESTFLSQDQVSALVSLVTDTETE